MRRAYTLLILLILFIPFLQRKWNIPSHDHELDGYNASTPNATFSLHHFLEGTYQDTISAYLQENVGYKGYLIALKNQIDYSFFHTLHYTIEEGRDGQLFYWDHIDTHCGHLSLSDDSLDKKIQECVLLRSILDSAHIPMLFVLAPGKPGYYEDKLPDEFLHNCSSDNDYHHIYHKLHAQNFEVVDFNAWFRSMRYTTRYPLFARLGIHWSLYGACLATDSLARYTEQRLHIDLPDYRCDHIRVTDQPYTNDKDLWSLLNLLLPMQSDSLAYPTYVYSQHVGQRKPKVLLIGDSFNWNIIDTKMPAELFSPESRFWFYKQWLYDLSSKNIANDVHQVNIYDLLHGTDLVIFLSTERLNHRVDFGFYQALISQPGAVDSLLKKNNSGIQ